MADIIISLDSKIGIKRDNTNYNSEYYIDGEWCRFYDNSPKKMGGYKLIYSGTAEVIRTLYEFNNSNTVNVYLGREIGGISFLNINSNGIIIASEINRTPLGYIPMTGNVWIFDQINYLQNGIPFSIIFAQVAPNDINTNSNIEGNIYYGGAYDTTLFQPVMNNATPSAPITASGGVIVATPFVIAYGNYGVIQWSNDKNPLEWDTKGNTAVIANTPKIITAATIRDNVNISLLFWCIDKLVRSTYDTSISPNTFSSVVLDDTISILSRNSVCEYNNIYYWIGNTQFYLYDGIVKKLSNNLSTDYFFNNLNRQYQGRIFTTVVKKYSEIWFHWPKGTSTEANEILIYNIESDTFYDASISRTCSVPPSAVLPYPLLANAVPLLNSGIPVPTYGIWMHEYGVDEIISNNVYAIKSRIVTKYFSFPKDNPQNDTCTILKRIENDFNQVGNIQFRIWKKAWPNTPAFYSDYYTITPTTEKIDINNEDKMSRIWAIEFISNEAGGDFILGRTQAVLSIGDKRPQPTEVTD